MPSIRERDPHVEVAARAGRHRRREELDGAVLEHSIGAARAPCEHAVHAGHLAADGQIVAGCGDVRGQPRPGSAGVRVQEHADAAAAVGGGACRNQDAHSD